MRFTNIIRPTVFNSKRRHTNTRLSCNLTMIIKRRARPQRKMQKPRSPSSASSIRVRHRLRTNETSGCSLDRAIVDPRGSECACHRSGWRRHERCLAEKILCALSRREQRLQRYGHDKHSKKSARSRSPCSKRRLQGPADSRSCSQRAAAANEHCGGEEVPNGKQHGPKELDRPWPACAREWRSGRCRDHLAFIKGLLPCPIRT